ncbi:TRAP transporter large permease subunit [uncultured Tateyamaria sp.]|uniref:TRAP transporter large permease subunit n=1 Tax=uncultured Tateyamaria sp. TaxID=455651 RepID=UPI002628BCA2|nr:TRAP transporter large permease subunit [uncultured Tateyamaria sp.]
MSRTPTLLHRQSDPTNPIALEKPKWFGSLHLGFSYIAAMLAAGATLWIFVIMLMICADVIGLKVFSRPLYGVVELTGASIVAVVFAQLPHTLFEKRMTRADFLISTLEIKTPHLGLALNLIFCLCGLGIFAALAWMLIDPTRSALLEGEFIGTQGIFTMQVWPIKAIILLGVTMTALEFGFQSIRLAHAILAEKAVKAAIVPFGLVLLICIAVWVAPDIGRIGIGVIGVVAMVLMILLGIHIPVAMMLVALVGVWLIRENPTLALKTIRSAATGTINKFDFGVVPLFVLMGLLVDASDLGKDAYRVAASLLRRLYGGLAIATVAANTVFAAITGISIASAAVFTRVAVPQMTAHHYSSGFAAGTVAGSSVLGMLIPPSLLLIIYGFVTETSVGSLFIAATLPGLLLAISFCLFIYLAARFAPEKVGCPDIAEDIAPVSGGEVIRALAPIFFLVFVVLGGIYGGVFTPTQAGAVGAATTLIVAVARRSLTWTKLWLVMKETGVISVTILLLIIAAAAFTKMLVMSGIPNAIVSVFLEQGISFWGFMLGYFAVIILLGMFLDSTSIILIVVPLVVGIVPEITQGIVASDPLIWFGIVTIIAVEIGLLTPPFGITVYVVKATLATDDVTLTAIFRGAFPYVLIMAVVMLILTAFPMISLFWLMP